MNTKKQKITWRFLALSIPLLWFLWFITSFVFYVISLIAEQPIGTASLLQVIKNFINYWLWLLWLLAIPATIVWIVLLTSTKEKKDKQIHEEEGKPNIVLPINQFTKEITKKDFSGIDMISLAVSVWLKWWKYFCCFGAAAAIIVSLAVWLISFSWLATVLEEMKTTTEISQQRWIHWKITSEEQEKAIQNIENIVTTTLDTFWPVVRLIGGVVLLLLVSLAFFVFVYFLELAKYIIMEAKEPEPMVIYERARESRGRVITTMMIEGVFTLLLMFLFIIPGLIFAIYWTMSKYVPLFHPEKKNTIALDYAKSLVQWRRRFTLGQILVFGLIRGLCSVMISLVVNLLTWFFGEGASIIQTGISTFVSYAIQPISSIALMTLYLNYEINKRT